MSGIFGLSTPVETETGSLKETQTGCLDTAPNQIGFIFQGWYDQLGGGFDEAGGQPIGLTVSMYFPGDGFPVGEDTLGFYTSLFSFTTKTWTINCYFLFDGSVHFRQDVSGNYLGWAPFPEFMTVTVNGFCVYPQTTDDGLNGCGITLASQGTKGLITKHQIISTGVSSDGFHTTPVMLAPATPLNITVVNLIHTAYVNYASPANDGWAVCFWIGLTADDIAGLPAANFNPQDKNLWTMPCFHGSPV